MDPKLKAFLDLIGWSEGADYGTIVTGVDGPETFTDFSDHPFAKGRPAKIVRHVPLLTSTASGRYQLLLRFWRAYQQMLNLSDFSPASQDAVAIRQIEERGAISMIEAGDIHSAISACSNIWASLPGNDYGQAGGHTMDELMSKYQELLGEAKS